jgi:hypothetical protein
MNRISVLVAQNTEKIPLTGSEFNRKSRCLNKIKALRSLEKRALCATAPIFVNNSDI